MKTFPIGTLVEAIQDYNFHDVKLLTSGKRYKVQDVNFIDRFTVVVQADNGMTYQFDPSLFSEIKIENENNVINGLFAMQGLDVVQFEKNLRQLIAFGEDSFGMIHMVYLIKPILKELESKRNDKYPNLFNFTSKG